MTDYSPRIISKINETPALLSLLYDANLLPEQINSEREYTCLQAVVMAYTAGEQAHRSHPMTAPERIWATHSETWGAVELGQWADTVRHKGGTEYVRADLLDDAMKALEECEAEIDTYIRQEYPSDHPVHEQYRQRDFSANPARIALAAIFAKLRSKP